MVGSYALPFVCLSVQPTEDALVGAKVVTWVLVHAKQKVSQSESKGWSPQWSQPVTMHQEETLVITAHDHHHVTNFVKSVDQLLYHSYW